jgi:hypothetical protein
MHLCILVWIRGSDNRENKEKLKIIVGTVRYGTVRILGSVLKNEQRTGFDCYLPQV